MERLISRATLIPKNFASEFNGTDFKVEQNRVFWSKKGRKNRYLATRITYYLTSDSESGWSISRKTNRKITPTYLNQICVPCTAKVQTHSSTVWGRKAEKPRFPKVLFNIFKSTIIFLFNTPHMYIRLVGWCCEYRCCCCMLVGVAVDSVELGLFLRSVL